MKNLRKTLWVIILSLSLGLFTTTAFSQGPGAPPPPNHGSEGTQNQGGRAPIGGGLAILLALGAGYGAKKYYDVRKKKLID
jgi:hypothetical protein